MALETYTTSNVTNSVTAYLSKVLLDAGYLIHWHRLDALQTPTAVYPQYQAGGAAVLRDVPAVRDLLPITKGIIALRDDDFSFPTYPVRPNSDGAVVAPEDVPIPTIALKILPSMNGRFLGMGSKERERRSSLLLYGLARDAGEQSHLADVLRVAFDEYELIPIKDHDGGTLGVVGVGEVLGTNVDTFTYPSGPASKAFEFTLNARLVYEA
jgi:hypothetical protein